MAHVAPIYPNFARGEVSPLMFGRIDIEQYPSCLDKCRNTYIRPYGCATRLTGTEYIAGTKNNGKARLLKFVFSPTDSYIIECGAGYFRFYQNGAPVMKDGLVYEVTNYYSEAQLASIQYVQLDDIIKLTCLPDQRGNSSAHPKELIRNASDDWTFRNVTFVETPYLDQNTSSITMKPDSDSGNITITASSAYFTSQMIGANMWIGTKVKDSTTNKDVQGYVKITGYTSATEVSATVQSKLSVNNVATKLWGEGAFSDRRGYPAVVALYDGRLYYARTPYQPRNVYGSKPYAYETFTPAVDNEDDAGINIALATNANGDGSDIKWMIGGSYLLCGTYGGEFVIRGTGDGAITATDISARQRTNWGGEPIQPIVAGTFVHFIQRNGNKLRQFQYDFYYDAYKAVDVSIFSEHLLASPIKAMALQKNPDSVIYLVRADGNVVMLTLEQDQSVQAWSLLEDMGAKVESIQTIPSYDGNYDEVYMVMNRSLLSTTLAEPECSNPYVTVTSTYTGQRGVEGVEIIELTYDSDYGIWTNPDSEKLYTKLDVTSSNVNLVPSTAYKLSKDSIGIVTEVLQFAENSNYVSWSNFVPNSELGVHTWFDISSASNNLGNSYYVAIAESGHVSVSTDGDTWSEAAIPNPAMSVDNWRCICLGNLSNTGNAVCTAISWNGYVASGSLQNGSVVFALVQQNTNLGAHKWQAITRGSGKFVALGYDGHISTSTNGYNWTKAVLNSNLNTENTYRDGCNDIAYGNGVYMVVSEGYVFTSPDGTTWSKAKQVGSHFYDNITFNGTNFILTDSQGSTAIVDVQGNLISEMYWKLSTARSIGGLTYCDSKLTALGYSFTYSGGIATGVFGAWQSQTTGDIITIKDTNYAISYTGTPAIGDTLTCVWTTVSGYVPLTDYKLTVTGTPEDGDVITLTFDTQYTSSARYIERMLSPITPENPYNWWYVRSGLKYDGFARTQGVSLTLSANSGTVTATATHSIFTNSMIGNRIRFIDSSYNILGEGTITARTSGTVVTLEIATYFKGLTLTGGRWGISADRVSGLNHLENQSVQVFADGKQQANKVVSSGRIDIDDAFVVVAGLPYRSYITTMPMEAGSQNGTAVGKRKRISEMAIRVWNSLGVRVGRDLDNLYDTIYEQEEPFTGVIPNIKYNQGWVWDANITVEQSHPYPMNILSIAPLVTEVDK